MNNDHHVVVRHYGQVILEQSWDDFLISSAAYMSTQCEEYEDIMAWYTFALRGGIQFC